MKSIYALVLLVIFLLAVPLPGAVRGNKAMYAGGSIAAIPESQQGKLDVSGESLLVFAWGSGKWEVPFKNVTKMEYGQKAGRRVGAAIAVTPLLLFSKKRKHYLTMQIKDEAGKGQAAVFELSKGTYQQTMATLEAKTGLKVERESEEARKEK
jgi:hypothetical protein